MPRPLRIDWSGGMRMKWKKSTAAAVLLFGLAAASLAVHSVSEIMSVTPVFAGEEEGLNLSIARSSATSSR